MSSPTSRTLDHLRDDGWTVQVVEKWNPHSKTRLDLFGFIDVLAVKGAVTLAVQATSGPHVAERADKIRACDRFPAVVAAGWRIVVHGWAKRGPRGKRKTWTLREVVVAEGRGPEMPANVRQAVNDVLRETDLALGGKP